jgi:hypothetical protein
MKPKTVPSWGVTVWASVRRPGVVHRPWGAAYTTGANPRWVFKLANDTVSWRPPISSFKNLACLANTLWGPVYIVGPERWNAPPSLMYMWLACIQAAAGLAAAPVLSLYGTEWRERGFWLCCCCCKVWGQDFDTVDYLSLVTCRKDCM